LTDIAPGAFDRGSTVVKDHLAINLELITSWSERALVIVLTWHFQDALPTGQVVSKVTRVRRLRFHCQHALPVALAMLVLPIKGLSIWQDLFNLSMGHTLVPLAVNDFAVCHSKNALTLALSTNKVTLVNVTALSDVLALTLGKPVCEFACVLGSL